MARRAAGAPLRVLLVSLAAPPVNRAAHAAIGDLGLDPIEPVDWDQLPPAAAVHARLRTADILVVLLDNSASDLGPFAQLALLHQQRPLFLFVCDQISAESATIAMLGDVVSGEGHVVHTASYHGPEDLHWKLAQTLAGFLSARFRQTQQQQSQILSADPVAQRRVLAALATHRDVRQRRIATRLALNYISRYPEDAEGLARQLVATGRAGAFQIAGQALHALFRADPNAANLLLHDLSTTTPAFREWIFAHLQG